MVLQAPKIFCPKIRIGETEPTLGYFWLQKLAAAANREAEIENRQELVPTNLSGTGQVF